MNEEEKSKSQKKREVEALQALGMQLTRLSRQQLDTLPLHPPLKEAILSIGKIKSHGAMRRQAQLIGKLMRSADHEAILSAYTQLMDEGKSQTANFHEAESWRERLIAGDNQTLSQFVECFQPEDIQQLRQRIQKAKDDLKKEKNTGAAKALFRYIRALMP